MQSLVRLSPLDQQEYEEWLAAAILAYADEKARAGNWTREEAAQRSREEFSRLLPGGLATPGQHLYSIRLGAGHGGGETHVGVLWMAVDTVRRRAFVYDFVVFEPYRRRGYGAQALAAVEAEARALGASEIGLHVFGHNVAARLLYEKMGYEVTNVSMLKRLT